MFSIQADGLLLRPIASTDARRFAELVNDESLARFTSRIPYPYTLGDAQVFVRLSIDEQKTGEEYRFAVCRDDVLIACTGVRLRSPGIYELGYWVGRANRGDGIATSAARAVTFFAFRQLEATKVTAGHFIDNPASAHILRKVGFRPTGKSVMTPSLARGCAVETPQYDIIDAQQQLTSDIAIAPIGA